MCAPNRRQAEARPLDPAHRCHSGGGRDGAADRKSATPEAANDWLKSLKVVFKWAVDAEHAVYNPAKDVPKIKTVTQGFHTWSDEVVEQYESKYPVGTT